MQFPFFTSVQHKHGWMKAGGHLRLPVYFTVIEITPEHLVGGHVHIQGHSVLQSGDDLRVLTPEQVNAADFMAVGEHQVWTVS